MKYVCSLLITGLIGSSACAQITFDEIPLPGPQMDYTQTIDTGDYVITNQEWQQTRLYGRKNADSSYRGFTYSNIQDSITPGQINDRAAFPAIGENSSAQYGVGHGNCSIYVDRFLGVKPAWDAAVYSIYITNATCAVLSMEYGDSTAKKFGGADGTDPDWFLLTIKGYNYTSGTVDSVLFYLADFRSDTPAMDYIVKDWVQVDLSSMGRMDSLSFSLSSSDTGSSGMNTPAYFCVDKINIERTGAINEAGPDKQCSIFPNPVSCRGQLCLDVPAGQREERYKVIAYTIAGKRMLEKQVTGDKPILLSDIAPGLYFFIVQDKEQRTIYRQKIRIR